MITIDFDRRGVEIFDTFIPAVNLQEPGWYEFENYPREWFDGYFEIMFETGDLWVISYTLDFAITLEVHHGWGFTTETFTSLDENLTVSAFFDKYKETKK